MKRFRITVAYDGTGYSGWQVQNGVRTIEGELNRSLSGLTGEKIEVIGASRTDSGVHALGNIAVFDSQIRIPAEKLPYALNQRLPEDIRVQQGEEVAADFHPRRVPTIKTYEYKIITRAFPLPTERLYCHYTYHKLDVAAMQAAAACLTGEHDFTSFCSAKTMTESKVRRIISLTVEKNADVICIRVRGNGFLYNMVRIIAGTLLKAGEGVVLPEQMCHILQAKDRQAAGPTLPPNGLTLMGICYHAAEETGRME